MCRWPEYSGALPTDFSVVADTSMMTSSPEYAAHFLEVYVKKTENAKFTGDRVRFLMLTLPFLVRDLIAPEVT